MGDPLSQLIEALSRSPGSLPASARHAGAGAAQSPGGGRLERAAQLVPERPATAVGDVADSQLLEAFRRQHAAGLVESKVLDGVLGLLSDVLAARGLLIR